MPMPMTVIVTRDVEDRYRGFLSSVMLEVAPPRLSKRSQIMVDKPSCIPSFRFDDVLGRAGWVMGCEALSDSRRQV